MALGFSKKTACLACGLLGAGAAHADSSFVDNFSGVTTQMEWKALGTNGAKEDGTKSTTTAVDSPACLTASGNGDGHLGGNTGIPMCAGNQLIFDHASKAKQSNDPPGHGALRLTPARLYQTGAIISKNPFPTSQGVQITFTTYTYNGSQNGGASPSANNGADGIAFFLTDGGKPMPTATGATGGALGYSCSNAAVIFDGMADAYLGLGIDEWGNFLNAKATTSSGILNTNNQDYAPSMAALGLARDALGGNTWGSSKANDVPGDSTGKYYQAMRIGLRGAGNTNWAWLKTKNSSYYSGAADASKVQDACKNARYVSKTYPNGTPLEYTPIAYNYNAIPGGYYVLGNDQKIASNSNQTRVDTKGAPNSAIKPITYKLSISPSGFLNFSFSYDNGIFRQVLSNRRITDDNGPLPPSFRFGFAAGTGGSDNVHEITCFQVTPSTSNSSAGGNTSSGEVQIGSQIYLAGYTPDSWTGTVQAVPVVAGATLSLDDVPNWDAACVLTGGACASTGQGSGRIDGGGSPQPLPGGDTTGDARVLLTSDPNTQAGTPFRQNALNDALSANVVRWLRGDRSTEQLWGGQPGTLRARVSVLGDIINSSPTWVGPPQVGAYPEVFADLLHHATGDESQYGEFAASYKARQPVVYAGSNDGFLHGFRTGRNDPDPAVNTVGNDGLEVIGFMPSGQLRKYAADIANPLYSHHYVVDATPGVGDLYYGGQWHTWLVGGVGSAGQEIYALDITDPDSFKESNAANLVRGDWTASAGLLDRLNCSVGKPLITRLHNGQWAIIFGNGLPDPAGANPQNCLQKAGTYTSGIYVGVVDPDDGAVQFRFLDTGAGSSDKPNGIAEISALDVDGDSITDYVYGGDVQGNVWRFDLTSASAGGWGTSSFSNGAAAQPLFTTPAGQPITTAPVVLPVKTGGARPRMMVYFGTGRLAPATTSGAAAYASGQQTFYGIWDWNYASWGGAFASLGAPPARIDKGALLAQTATLTSATTRALPTDHAVCWADQAACPGNRQYGWYFDLSSATNEQIIYNPVKVGRGVVVNTAEPPVINAQACNPGQQTGWTMAFNPATGGGFARGFFANSDNLLVDGLYLGAVGSPTVLNYHGETYIVSQTAVGKPPVPKLNPERRGIKVETTVWRELLH